jgi:hypothetical protein
MVSFRGDSSDSTEGDFDSDWMALVGRIIRSDGREPIGMGYNVGYAIGCLIASSNSSEFGVPGIQLLIMVMSGMDGGIIDPWLPAGALDSPAAEDEDPCPSRRRWKSSRAWSYGRLRRRATRSLDSKLASMASLFSSGYSHFSSRCMQARQVGRWPPHYERSVSAQLSPMPAHPSDPILIHGMACVTSPLETIFGPMD